MDVAPAMDFDFTSSGAYYTSAPSSPTQLASELYYGFDELLISAGNHRISSLATVPFAWEEKPGVPKSPTKLFQDDDFSFDLSSQFASDSVPAEDLFHGGVIKTVDPPRERERGRERGFSASSSSSRSRRTRSLSPLGGSDYRRRQQQPPKLTANTTPDQSTSLTMASAPACDSSENGSRKWSFRDLFLFRSASDGRAMDKDPLKKYSNFFRKQDQEFTSSSSKSGSGSKRRGQVSAHEIHYNMNRAASNDMKKKTYLPYRQGILGGLPFNA